MGEHVNKSASGVYLTITESVAPFAAGKYVGPSIEIIIYKSDWNRKNILTEYKNEILNYVGDDIFDVTSENNEALNFQQYFLDKLFSASNVENIVE